MKRRMIRDGGEAQEDKKTEDTENTTQAEHLAAAPSMPAFRSKDRREQFVTHGRVVTIIPNCSETALSSFKIDDGLGFFWHSRPDLQHQELVKIAARLDGQVAIGLSAEGSIIGYLTITLPEEDMRWGRHHLRGLRNGGN